MVQAQLEARLAGRLAATLTTGLEELPPDVESRLRFAREQAMARRATASTTTVAVGSSNGGTGAAVLGRLDAGGRWWPRWGWLLPLAAMAAGVLLVQARHDRDAAAVAAQIDSALLADELPPAAYADPGFAAFLKLQQP